jgi:hypothetical protein
MVFRFDVFVIEPHLVHNQQFSNFRKFSFGGFLIYSPSPPITSRLEVGVLMTHSKELTKCVKDGRTIHSLQTDLEGSPGNRIVMGDG